MMFSNKILYCFCFFIFACNGINKRENDNLNNKPILFENVSEKDLANLSFLKRASPDLFIIYTEADSIPFFAKSESLFIARLKGGDVFYFNSEMHNNRCVLLLGSNSENKLLSLFEIGNVIDASIKQSDNYYILNLTENMDVFSFDNPQIKRKWFITLSADLDIIAALGVLQSGSVLQDEETHISINLDYINTPENCVKGIKLQGSIDQSKVSDTIRLQNGLYVVPYHLENLLWNNIKVIEQTKIKIQKVKE